jgi:transposase
VETAADEVFIPLTYRPGDLADVDFFEVLIDLAGERRKAWLLLLRLMYSGRDVGWINERQDQLNFLDGHVRAFAHLGGVPARIGDDYVPGHIVAILWRRWICGCEVARALKRGRRRCTTDT